jgi:hypothetical protein
VKEGGREKLGCVVKRAERGAGPHVQLSVGRECPGWAASAHARGKGGPANCLATRAEEVRWAGKNKKEGGGPAGKGKRNEREER